MKEWKLKNESELTAVVEEVVMMLQERKREDGAAVLALSGDLGAGKTTFTQYLARALGVGEVVTSPTFVVMKRYETTNQTFTDLVHIDAYRIEEESEMTQLRFSEILAEPNTLVVIEWAERISGLLPAHTLTLSFAITGEERIISVHG